jgi:hypothetical protein
MRRHPALDRPLVDAVVRLARKRKPEDLVELGTRLDELRFPGRPGFFASKEGPNVPEESAFRWLALPRSERYRYFERDSGFLPAIWIADWLVELLRQALRTGEAHLVEGPAAVMDSIEFGDAQILRAMRVDFGKKQVPELQSSVKPALRSSIQTVIKQRGYPGKSVQWARFCDFVRTQCGVTVKTRGYGDKSIERAVRAVAAEQDK